MKEHKFCKTCKEILMTYTAKYCPTCGTKLDEIKNINEITLSPYDGD